MLNIQWIYRAKKYFNLSPADIYALLIPIQYKISTVRFWLKSKCFAYDVFSTAFWNASRSDASTISLISTVLIFTGWG